MQNCENCEVLERPKSKREQEGEMKFNKLTTKIFYLKLWRKQKSFIVLPVNFFYNTGSHKFYIPKLYYEIL